jgi:S-phase kinase-associated protein 1
MVEAHQINLVLAEDHHVSVDFRFKALSGLLINILEDSTTDEEIPLMQVKFEQFKEVLEYANYHDFTEPEPIACPLPTTNIRDAVKDPWDADFIMKFDDEGLAELANTANYLDIRCLLDLCCGAIASRFKGKEVNTLRTEYGITEDFTPEAEEQVKQMFPWILEGDEERLLQAQKRT